MGLVMKRVKVAPEPGGASQTYVGIVNKARPPRRSVALALVLTCVRPAQVGDEVAKQGTRLSPAEIALFRAVVDATAADVDAAKSGVSSVDVLNLPLRGGPATAKASHKEGAGGGGGGDEGEEEDEEEEGGAGPSQKKKKPAAAGAANGAGGAAGGASPAAAAAPAALKLSLAERQAALDGLVADGWLFGSSTTAYRPGPRAFLELGDFLRDAASDEVAPLWNACM